MPNRRSNLNERDSDDSDWDDDESEQGEYDDGSETTIACPHCGKEVDEDAERCPSCEQYLSDEDAPSARKSWLIVIGAALCLYIVYHWLVG